MNSLAYKSKEYVFNEPIEVESCTDVGMIRKNNEDYYGYHIPENKSIRNKFGSLFAISDGVGGNAAGEVASAEAVNVLLQEYYLGAYSERVQDRLKGAFEYTARHIYDLSTSVKNLHNMKCTLSSLLIKHDKFYISHIGDSKIYLIRENKIIQLTKDHSLVGKLVRLGFVSEEKARIHPNRHILLKALGDRPIIPGDFYSGHVMAGDIFCLVTDGILEHASKEELNYFLNNDNSNEGLSGLLEELNDRGGYDNMTIMTVKINSTI